MKYLIVLCLTVGGGMVAHGQYPDFPLHANGLIYSDTLMSRLRSLIDSLQLHNKKEGADGVYYSHKQTSGRLVELDSGDVQDAFSDLRNGISFEAFVAKYPKANAGQRILVLQDEHPGYQVPGNVSYYNITGDYGTACITLATDEHYQPISYASPNCGIDVEHVGIKDNCVYMFSSLPHSNRGKMVKNPYVYAYFLDGTPAVRPLPQTAARLVGYRDRIMDSTSTIFYKNAKHTGPDIRGYMFGPAQDSFDSYIKRMAAPVLVAYHREHARANAIDDFQLERHNTDSLSLAGDPTFKTLLAAAVAEVEEKNYYPFIYLERYMDSYSPRVALDIRRRRIPSVTCGLDKLNPRLYLMHIAYLSAETGDWSVFLRTHLDIAVDPYGQTPDPSVPGRRTYFLRELEDLEIGANDLFLGNALSSPGIDLRFEAARRLGKALSYEAKDRATLEDKVLTLIADKGLDDYNRLALHYLFLNYVGFLPDSSERKKNISRLEQADKAFPDYLSAWVSIPKWIVDNDQRVALW